MGFAAPTTIKVALVLVIIGLIIFIIGFSAPYWIYQDRRAAIPVSAGSQIYSSSYNRRVRSRLVTAEVEAYSGLWKGCTNYEYVDPFANKKVEVDGCSDLLENVADRQRAAQFFECIALIASIISMVVFIVYAIVDSVKERRIFPILAAVLAIIAGGCALLGAIIYGTADGVADYLSWAFALTIVGGCLFGLAGIIGLVGVFMNK